MTGDHLQQLGPIPHVRHNESAHQGSKQSRKHLLSLAIRAIQLDVAADWTDGLGTMPAFSVNVLDQAIDVGAKYPHCIPTDLLCPLYSFLCLLHCLIGVELCSFSGDLRRECFCPIVFGVSEPRLGLPLGFFHFEQQILEFIDIGASFLDGGTLCLPEGSALRVDLALELGDVVAAVSDTALKSFNLLLNVSASCSDRGVDRY